MSRPGLFVFVFSLMILTAAGQFAAAVIPVEPYVDASFATSGPLSLCNFPNGGGKPFSQAFDQNGQVVDGTLTITLYDEIPPYGDPVPNFPNEDVWLEDLHGGLVFCQAGTIPDEHTDEFGMTYWSQPLLAGGHAEPVDGNLIMISVIGWMLQSPALAEFRTNSPDINGDLVVNLFDVENFTHSFFGAYDYASDFRWDGVLNLSDIVILAQGLGTECP